MTTATFRLAGDVPYIRFVKALADAGIHIRASNGEAIMVMSPELRVEITQRNADYRSSVREALRSAGLPITDCAA